MFTILGASGFIGGALVASLQKTGAMYFAPARGEDSIFTRPLGHIIYSIGMTADFRSRPIDTARAHVSVLADILEKADFESLTYLSSTRVYAGVDVSSPESRLTVLPANPSDLYNTTKLAGESLCLHGGREHTRVVRLSNVVGINQTSSRNFIDQIVKEALSGKLVMRTAKDSAKDYILLADVIHLLPVIAEYGEDPIYNLAAGHNIRNDEWTMRLQEETGCEVIYAEDAQSLIFPEIDISLIRQKFGFSPSYVINILPELIAHYSQRS